MVWAWQYNDHGDEVDGAAEKAVLPGRADPIGCNILAPHHQSLIRREDAGCRPPIQPFRSPAGRMWAAASSVCLKAAWSPRYANKIRPAGCLRMATPASASSTRSPARPPRRCRSLARRPASREGPQLRLGVLALPDGRVAIEHGRGYSPAMRTLIAQIHPLSAGLGPVCAGSEHRHRRVGSPHRAAGRC